MSFKSVSEIHKKSIYDSIRIISGPGPPLGYVFAVGFSMRDIYPVGRNKSVRSIVWVDDWIGPHEKVLVPVLSRQGSLEVFRLVTRMVWHVV